MATAIRASSRRLQAQARRLAVASRAYYNDRLGPFLAELCQRAGLDAALPMNTGAEAVETAIKAARRWGYHVKGIPHDRAEIIVADGNFHGRTTTIVGFSSEPGLQGRLRPVRARLPHRALRRSRRDRARHHAQHGRDPDRADPGRGRHHRAAGRLFRGPAQTLRRAQRALDPRRSAIRPRPRRRLVRLPS